MRGQLVAINAIRRTLMGPINIDCNTLPGVDGQICSHFFIDYLILRISVFSVVEDANVVTNTSLYHKWDETSFLAHTQHLWILQFVY